METDGLVIVGKKDTYQGSDNSVILLNRETSLCAFLSLSRDMSFFMGFRHNMH